VKLWINIATLMGLLVGASVPAIAAGAEADEELIVMMSGLRHAQLCVRSGHAFTQRDIDQLKGLIDQRTADLSREVVSATRDLVDSYPMGDSQRECENIKFVLPAMLPAFKPYESI
jgi:hypothetical protein